MKKLSIVCLALVMALAFGFGTAFAASAKVTAKYGNLSLVEANAGWKTVFTQNIHTPSQKDLFIDVSLECGLTTNTKVMSKALVRAISEAEAMVEVRVMVDGVLAHPGEIVFAKRQQALIAEFAGSLSIPSGSSWEACLIDGPGGTQIIDPDCLLPEMLALILKTMAAHSFNFIVDDLAAGDHTVVVEAQLTYEQVGDAYADEDLTLLGTDIATKAVLGNGCVTIECVRMIKDEELLENYVVD